MDTLETLEKKRKDLKTELEETNRQIQDVKYSNIREFLQSKLGYWFKSYGRYFKILSVEEGNIQVIEVSWYQGKPTFEITKGYESDFNEKDLLDRTVPEKVEQAFAKFKLQVEQ